MNTAKVIGHSKQLNIDFTLYTDGDQHFKNELCLLLIDNIKELYAALQESVQTGELSIFTTICHKVVVSIDMINDEEVNDLIAQVKDAFGFQQPFLITRYGSKLSAALIQLVKSIEEEICLA